MSNVVAVASVISSGVVGLGAVWSGWRDRKAARELAREDRTQQRLADAYVEVLTVASRIGAWAQAIRPIVDTDPPRPLPPIPDAADQHATQALADAFGSEPVRSLQETWQASVWDILNTDQQIRWIEADQVTSPGADKMTLWLKLDQELRPAEAANRKALVDQVARELGHRD